MEELGLSAGGVGGGGWGAAERPTMGFKVAEPFKLN